MLASAFGSALSSAGNVLLLAFGFGFVIFWHELGHFLAAKWADVKVEQFAVGFGQALFSWRKGLGFRWGSTQAEYQSKLRQRVELNLGHPEPAAPAVPSDEGATGAGTFGDLPTDNAPKLATDPSDAQLDRAAADLGLSDTEYRLNWIPLGGYVKMLGQDDLKPGEQVANPRSYTSKSVGKRMIIVSAGVVMNVILAGIGFMILFTVGYKVSAPVVGQVIPGSPAQLAVRAADGKPAPIRPGDTIEYIDGKYQADFDKIKLNSPLLIAGDPVLVEVLRDGGKMHELLRVTPAKPSADGEFPQLGIAPSHSFEALEGADAIPAFDPKLEPKELNVFHDGDRVTAVAGEVLQKGDSYSKLADALQKSAGHPVAITVTGVDGRARPEQLVPHFVERFHADDPVSFAGLQMLPRIAGLEKNSSAKGKLLPGDVVTDVADVESSGGHKAMPTREEMTDFTHAAGDRAGSKLIVTVLRDGTPHAFELEPNVRLDHDRKGLGVQLDSADGEPLVAHPAKDSPAERAGIPGGARLVTVNGRPIANWFDVYTAMSGVQPSRPVPVTAVVAGKVTSYSLPGLTAAELDAIRENRLDSYATGLLQPATGPRKAKNPLQAAEWGVGETRDAILQVYLTVRAMVRGSISPKEISGPVGILTVGYKLAETGNSRLLWFLSIISANLAVMNFLPIPVVDGGLFTFLVIEKLKGSPISQRTQSIAQVVGLALLLSVFVFATWQDVSRLPMLFH